MLEDRYTEVVPGVYRVLTEDLPSPTVVEVKSRDGGWRPFLIAGLQLQEVVEAYMRGRRDATDVRRLAHLRMAYARGAADGWVDRDTHA